MSGAQWLGSVALVVWFLGVGLLAHAVPHFLQSDAVPDYVRVVISMFTEAFAVPVAIVIVGWPITIPALILIELRKRKKT